MTLGWIAPAYCPNCGIDILSNPSPEKSPFLEYLNDRPGLYELRGYCDCGVVSYWSVSASAQVPTQPVLRLAAGTDKATGRLVLEVPPSLKVGRVSFPSGLGILVKNVIA